MISITSLKTRVKTQVKKLTVLFGSAAVMTLGINASAIAASMYDITDLGNLGQPFSYAYGINDAGQVVGYSGISPYRAFLWNRSTGMTNLGTLPGGTNSIAYDINNSGQVVGVSNSSQGDRAFLWNSSTGMTDLGTLPGKSSSASAINNTGQVVGTSSGVFPSDSRAFLWSSSTGITDLGTLPGGSSSSASGINDAGQVVGTSTISNGKSHAFLWNSRTGMTDIGTLPGKDSSSASAINNVGQVVGSSSNSNDSMSSRAFLWSSSTGTINLGTLPSQVPTSPDYTSSYALSINDIGQVVGYSLSAYSPTAFLWSSSTGIIDLNTLIDPSQHQRLDVATAINNQGQIVGYSRISSFDYHAFLLTPKSSTPVPEPATICGTMLAGAGLVYLRRRYGRRTNTHTNNFIP